MIPVIVNATAGAGHAESDFEGLRQLFRDAGAEARIFPARSGDEIRDLARAAMKESPPVLVAAGGDGTVSAVAELTRAPQRRSASFPSEPSTTWPATSAFRSSWPKRWPSPWAGGVSPSTWAR